MQATKKLAKAVSQEMADSLKSLEELVTVALTRAQKDNAGVHAVEDFGHLFGIWTAGRAMHCGHLRRIF